MKKTYQFFVLLLILCSSAFAQQPGPRRFVFNTKDPMVHDPVMAKEGNKFYVFYTGMGIENISSTDLINWKMESPVLKTIPDWIRKELPKFGGHTWAPDVIYYKGNYHIFYACSAFGRNTSVIGHAIRPTLNPEDSTHPWVDKGMVIESYPMKDNWNAIDPNVIVDEKGNPWMDFGSFWDGIQLVRLSKDMCKTIGTPVTIARRNHSATKLSTEAGENAIEAPFLFRHGGYYYLFVSWDYCCRGNNSTYKVAVGRSKKVEGPYVDKNGKKMEDGGGTVILFNNDEFNASGHCAAYHFDNKDYFICHAYSRKEFGASKMILREMTWDEEGWPIVDLNRPTSKDNKVDKAQFTVNVNEKGSIVNPGMYGIFFEEINHSGDGSLYGELLQNRNFEEHVVIPGCTEQNGWAQAPHKINYGTQAYSDWRTPWKTDSLKYVGWKVEGKVDYDVVDDNPLHPATPHSLKLVMKGKDTKLINSGYWGVPMRNGEKYNLRFYVLAKSYKGFIHAQIVSSKGEILSDKEIKIGENGKWNEYKAELISSGTDPKCTFQLQFSKPGTVFVDYVSLFPQKTFKNRENGMRADVAQALADLHPGFMRWPGGCVVEGVTQKNGFKWKNTIGDPMTRKSEWITWNYHCSWGFGYHEFLQLCEDINAASMLVTNVGLSCTVRNGDYVNKDSLNYFIQDISDAIEYAVGDPSTVWGAKRAAAGHPEPFNLKYVELGNEQIGPIYAEIYKTFYKTLKAKYPNITFINTIGFDSENLAKAGKVDMIDPHWYASPEFFHSNTDLFDNKERGHFDVYVGEYAAIIGAGNMKGALGEAAWMSGMEHNGDLVKMCSYAPLLENANRRDWPTNLIWVSNDQTMGRTSYYVQQMYSTNTPSYNLNSSLSIPENNSCTKGFIGFSSNQLNEKFRNLKISENEKVLYEDKLENMKADIIEKPTNDHFHFNALPIKFFKDKAFDNETIEYETCPLLEGQNSAYNVNDFRNRMNGTASLIFGADEAGQNYFLISMNVYRNTISISRVVDGAPVNLSNNENSFTFERGKWYKVRIVLENGNRVSCYMDNNKALEVCIKPYSTFHAIAGYDEKTGETVVKVINGSSHSYPLSINLNCSEVSPTGKIIMLKAESDKDENSFTEPKKIVPVTTDYNGFGKEFNYTFEPYSFTIMRIKSAK